MTDLLSSTPAQSLPTTPADTLRARLDDPQVAAALNTILDNADVLALAVLSVDGLLRRGDVIADNLADGLNDVRAIARSAAFLREPTRRLAEEATDIADAAEALLDSGMLNKEVVTLLGQLAISIVEGTEAAERNRTTVNGVLPLLRALKDPDVGKGLGVAIEVARALGRRF